MSFPLEIPTSGTPFQLTLEAGSSTLFVGANGSGKTRLAVHIETSLGDKAHRISAHRALVLNPGVAKINESSALKGLRYGLKDEQAQVVHRSGHRWAHKKEAISLLNDFDFLLQALFAEQTRTALDSHHKAYRGEQFKAAATKFQKLEIIWQALLPHRDLIIEGDDIKVRAPGGQSYSGADMSDGERAIFYLIGQVLVAEKDSVLIVDEPELHVHRSIMSKLWDQLESARKDCAFIFITHDLEFAAGRVGKKFMIESFSGAEPVWTINSVPEDTGFSEELTTLLLGSRHPVLFVEGERKSLDMAVYRVVYPGWTVVPRGSCQSVIHAVATFRANPALTRIQCAGVIDADDYDAGDRDYLRDRGVFVLPVAEVENLFVLPTIALEITKLEHLQGEAADARVQQLRRDIVTMFGDRDLIDKVILRYVLRRIDRTLKRVDFESASNIDALASLYEEKVREVDVVDLATRRRAAIHAAIQEPNFEALLALVDHKAMLAAAASRLRNTKLDVFEGWLTRALLSDHGRSLVEALRAVLPVVAPG